MNLPKRIRVQGDGSVTGTKVTDAQTGEELNAFEISLLQRVGEVPLAAIRTWCPEVDVVAELGSCVEMCPFCGREAEMLPDGKHFDVRTSTLASPGGHHEYRLVKRVDLVEEG